MTPIHITYRLVPLYPVTLALESCMSWTPIHLNTLYHITYIYTCLPFTLCMQPKHNHATYGRRTLSLTHSLTQPYISPYTWTPFTYCISLYLIVDLIINYSISALDYPIPYNSIVVMWVTTSWRLLLLTLRQWESTLKFFLTTIPWETWRITHLLDDWMNSMFCECLWGSMRQL